MSEIRVTCRNEEEAVKVLEIAEKEGYTWTNKKATSFKPYANYPYYIVMCKNLRWSEIGCGKPSTAQDFIDSYNTDHAEPCEISQKVKNEIILDFMKKWHEIREGCDERECHNCKFIGDKDGDIACKLDNVDDTADEETFLEAVKLLMDVVDSGDTRILQLTTNDAVVILRKEIETLYGKEDDEARGRIEALKMAVSALEERENGFRTKSD